MIPVLAAVLALVIVPAASAFTQRPYKEAFGSAAQPAFVTAPTAIGVDRKTGEVLIADGPTLRRFHVDGTPAPFARLGTNVIDGAEANGKPCAEEAASCDETPQGRIEVLSERSQISVDESGGPAQGDIYVAQADPAPGLVDIFASDGRYLGQLTETGDRPFPPFGAPKGVTVDSTGTVYVGSGEAIDKFVPSANPVTNADFDGALALPAGYEAANLNLGAGPTAGSLFVAGTFSERTLQGNYGVPAALRVDTETGQTVSRFANGQPLRGSISVNRETGDVLTGAGTEYEFPAGSEPVRIGRLIVARAEELRGGLAFTSSDEVIVGEFQPNGVSIYGAPAIVPTVTEAPAQEVAGTRAVLVGTVDRGGGPPVTECTFEYGEAYVDTGGVVPKLVIKYEHKAPCEGLDPNEPGQVRATLSDLEPNGQRYGFRLVAFNENGPEETEGQTFTTAATLVTEPATSIGETAATLNGIVRPEGSRYSECSFEYGLATSAAFEGKAPCDPPASAIEANFQPQEVSARITGLQGDREYRYRLVATSTDAEVGTIRAEEQRFSTFGVPRISEVRASGADQGSVNLEAKIDPNGSGTTYRFEWGQTPAYGNLAPVEFAPFVGSGQEPVAVQAKLAGLVPGSTYHYRVTATSSRGVTQSADHIAETLNSCNLPQGRCFELVSRSAAGPVALAGEANAYIEMHFQAATAGPALTYPVEGGYPESTKSADVQYRARRGADAWESTQLSPPIEAVNERNDGGSVSSATQFLSDDLSCGFTESVQPLTADPSMALVRESGSGNLYRINPEGSSAPYTGVTNLPPENAEGGGLQHYQVAGASQDCSVVVFTTQFQYPGIQTAAKSNSDQNLYEWRDGTLHNVGMVPGPDDEVTVAAVPGTSASVGVTDRVNSVSEDGSRIFFTAERKTSPDPAEVDVPNAVFVREDGRETRDVSLSETAVPDKGATYQWATPDGSSVFFTANAGLTAKSNAEGTDLYEYDLDTEKLTDRSVTGAEGGAQVTGFLGGSADGSEVYFASPNQLIPGAGNSLVQNTQAKSFSIYGEREGQISFVGTFNQSERKQVLIEDDQQWVSQVSPDGRFLLFESSAQVTGYQSQGVREAYLYDAATGGVTCVSCRQDGQPSTNERYGRPGYLPLARGFAANTLHPPRFLVERAGEPEVFFISPDPLAPGAVAGQNNVYEWAHDQVFRLVSAAAGTQTVPSSGKFASFGGAADDGSDVYVTTTETLSWQDGDERISVYDARVGGGYPQPAASPQPCVANEERSCVAAPPAAVGPRTAGTTGDRGDQNVGPKKGHGKTKHKKKHKQSKHKKHKQSKHRKKPRSKKTARRGNRNPRSGK